MTPWHYRYLCAFVGNDLIGELGQTLGALCIRILREDDLKRLKCGALGGEARDVLKVISGTSELSRLKVIDYINLDETTGFVGYAFEARDQSVTCAFRGSEWVGCEAKTNIDWWDDFGAPFHGSVQYSDVERFIAPYPAGAVTFSGHSKGGHNALYACAASANPAANAVAFNAQGFAPGYLNFRQNQALRKRAVNYVVQDDIVGALMAHPENRTFVKRKHGEFPHSLTAFTFDEAGNPVPGKRPLWSHLIEMATILYLRHVRR